MHEKIIVSPTSMTVLNTPLVEYYRSRLAEEFDPGAADRIIKAEYRYMARMDEGETPETEMDLAVDNVIHPLLGIAEGIKGLGYSDEHAKEVVLRIWEEAPQELKTIPTDAEDVDTTEKKNLC